MKTRRALFSALSCSFAVAACAADQPPFVTPGAAPRVATPPPVVLNEPRPTVRLPKDTRPTAETLELAVDPAKPGFSGKVTIAATLDQPRHVIWLHGKNFHVLQATATPSGGKTVSGTWKQEDSTGLASLTFAEALPAGNVAIHIEYDSPWGPRLEGLHVVTQGGVPYAFTQFESIAARDAFPCFDEPGFKIPFDTTLLVPKGSEAIANTHEISRAAEGDAVRVHFAPTLPIPSYLVAFAVGPLDIVAGPDVPPNAVRKRPLPLRVVTTRGHGKEAAYALAHTGEILTLLEQFFGSEYPYDKLDIIAVPDKGGAMENPGAVTFADSLLLFDPKTAPVRQIRSYAGVMTHELAHQWTGDLVTAAFWDDIWLNEAFATWVAAKVTDAWDPKMDSHMSLLQGVQGASGRDSFVTARAIRQPIVSANDIENAFDSITYQKGGGVLSMFERWVGPEIFQRGLQTYLSEHRFGAATADDFLGAESRVSGKDVATPFHNFLDQPGIPFLETEVRCDGSPRLHLKQSRYLPLGSSGDANKTWQIPVCARYHAGKETKEACTLLTEREGDLPLGPTCPDWVFPNADASGYYRVGFAPADLANVRQKAFASLTTADRVAYIASLRSAANRATLPMKEVMLAAAPLATDSHRDIAREPMAYVEQARDWLYDDAARPAVEAYGRRLFAPAYAKLGWQPGKKDDADARLLRTNVISFLALVAQDPTVRAEAKRRGLAYLGVGTDHALHPEAVDPNLASVALQVLGEEADRALWDGVRARLAKTEDAEIRRRLLTFLVSNRRPELQAAVRDLSFDPVLRATEVPSPLATKMADPATREATWSFEQANFDRLLAAFPAHHGQTQLIAYAENFCDEAHAAAVEAFFTPARIASIDGSPRVLASTLESIRLCAAKRKAQEASTRELFTPAGAEAKAAKR